MSRTPAVRTQKLVQPRSKFSASTSNVKSQNEADQNTGNENGRSFLQALSNISQTKKNGNEDDHVYIHPLAKRSSSKLNEKSLEMCTESLGSETGSDVSESNDDDVSLPSPEAESSLTNQISKLQEAWPGMSKRQSSNGRGKFPPPLKSMSVKVKSRREGSRLLLEAVPLPSHAACFHAERLDGRLLLRFVEEEEEEATAEGPEEEEEEFTAYAANDEEDGDYGEGMEGISESAGLESEWERLLGLSGARKGGEGARDCCIGSHFGWQLEIFHIFL